MAASHLAMQFTSGTASLTGERQRDQSGITHIRQEFDSRSCNSYLSSHQSCSAKMPGMLWQERSLQPPKAAPAVAEKPFNTI